MCQTVKDISITIQFHEFFVSHFRRIFAIYPNSTDGRGSGEGVRLLHHRHGQSPAQGGVHRRRTARRGLQALVPWLAAAARVALGALVGAEGEARDHPGTDVCVSVCVLKAVSKSLDVS